MVHKYNAVGQEKMTAGLTGLPAGFTVSTVTRLLAAMEATVELVAADQGTLVLHILDGERHKTVTPPPTVLCLLNNNIKKMYLD